MIWTFGKEKARISLGRQPDSCVLVVVRGRDQVREYRFGDVTRLRVFQPDREGFCGRAGWTLLSCSPERRRQDREGGRFPRQQERRRWWTDARPAERDKVVWGGKWAGQAGSNGYVSGILFLTTVTPIRGQRSLMAHAGQRGYTGRHTFWPHVT